MSSLDKELMNPVTIDQMVSTFDQTVKTLTTVKQMLKDVQAQVNLAFGNSANSHVFDVFSYIKDWNAKDDHRTSQYSKFKRAAWYRIVDKTRMRRFMSKKRIRALEENMERGELQEISIINIMDFLTILQGQVGTLAEEVVKEAFEFLRPPGSKYKTNTEFEVGKRAILGWMVDEKNYGAGRFKVRYGGSETNLEILDKAFHLMDGKGLPKSYNSPLIDAINTSESGRGETEYFEFKCYMNRNLHLKFLRPDLVEKMNAMAGGNNLRGDYSA